MLEKILCPNCSEEILHDGSACGTEFPCPQCNTLLVMPGRKPDSLEVKTGQYNYVIYGQHPVQADGLVLGYHFYFRAKWDFWDFTVCTSHDFPDAPTIIEPADGKDGFFTFEEYEGYRIGKDYGTDASYMSIETANCIIKKCVESFLGDCEKAGS